ncbi:hypothetical protein GCM10010971_13370 [Silvimonas amylolytica]|uniref:Uncharacterized protein n=2 Tax=Silvimonas amylolytica TaxID=449663 RepID=A0ABQ2PJN5_9NEIS|nr:hypothetical protein GCM10010971_13370 [Silvimonas amylolytica]
MVYEKEMTIEAIGIPLPAGKWILAKKDSGESKIQLRGELKDNGPWYNFYLVRTEGEKLTGVVLLYAIPALRGQIERWSYNGCVDEQGNYTVIKKDDFSSAQPKCAFVRVWNNPAASTQKNEIALINFVKQAGAEIPSSLVMMGYVFYQRTGCLVARYYVNPELSGFARGETWNVANPTEKQKHYLDGAAAWAKNTKSYLDDYMVKGAAEGNFELPTGF